MPEIILKIFSHEERAKVSPPLLSTLQEPKKEEEQLGILETLDRLEAAADNLLSRSVISNISIKIML